jgi:hypothetical protein
VNPKGDSIVSVAKLDKSLRNAAKVVGFTYLFSMATAVFAEFYIRSELINYDDAAKTAANIIAHEHFFRLGIACDLLAVISDVALITALYVILRTVNRNLALVALCWRLMETSIHTVMTLDSFNALRLLSGASYLQVFEANRLHALARLSIGSQNAAFNVSFLFLGAGSTVFAYLWFKSNYIPRALAAWGVFASVVVLICNFAFIIFPDLADSLSPGCFVPIFIFEVAMGFLLLLRGLNSSAAPRAVGLSGD